MKNWFRVKNLGALGRRIQEKALEITPLLIPPPSRGSEKGA